MNVYRLIQTNLVVTGLCLSLAPLTATAQTALPITEIRWFNDDPSDRWQGMRFTVPDQTTTTPANQGNLRRYDAHLAKMFELTHLLCQRNNQTDGYQWDYEAANGNIDMGSFKISCQLSRDIATAYGFVGSQSTILRRQYTTADYTPAIKTETLTVPKLNFTGGKASRWLTFLQKFVPEKMNAGDRKMQPFPIAKVLPKLKGKTTVPIFLPAQLPALEDVKEDYAIEVARNSYSVEIYLAPDCRAGACYFGSFSAERNGQFTEPSDLPRDTFRIIQLATGLKGVFYNGCGAYCTAIVEWKSKGVLYRVTGKNGQQAELVKLANSAIRAGAR